MSKFTVATALLSAGACFADPCVWEAPAPDASEYGIKMPTLYPFAENVLVQVFAPNSLYAGGVSIACTETLVDGTSKPLGAGGAVTFNNCVGVATTDGMEYNATGLTVFTEVDVDFITNYTIACNLTQDSTGLVLVSKIKEFAVVVENDVNISITSQDIKTEVETVQQEDNDIKLSDLLSVSLDGGAQITIEEGRMTDYDFQFVDISEDAQVNYAETYQIKSINGLTFGFTSLSINLAITNSTGGATQNAIATSIDTTGPGCIVSTVVPAGLISGETTNVTVSGDVTAELLNTVRRRSSAIVEDDIPFQASFTLTKQNSDSAGVSTAVSFITMMGVPATIIAAAGLF